MSEDTRGVLIFINVYMGHSHMGRESVMGRRGSLNFTSNGTSSGS